MKLRMQPMPGYSYNSEIASSQRKINLYKATRTIFSHRTVRIKYMGIDPGFRAPSVYIRSCAEKKRRKNVKGNKVRRGICNFYAFDFASSVVSEDEARTSFRSPERPSVDC
jgi:hypothetical protein